VARARLRSSKSSGTRCLFDSLTRSAIGARGGRYTLRVLHVLHPCLGYDMTFNSDIRHIPGRPRLGELFAIIGGDGDQNFLGKRQIIKLTEALWFHGKMWDSEALLFVIEGGEYGGKYVILTSKVVAGLVQQLTNSGTAGVVVHLVRNPTASFSGDEKDSMPIGMALVARI
jgi:hypothetical protein